MKNQNNINFAFFGTGNLAVTVLDKLYVNGFIPSLVITTPDKPVGRKLVLTPPPVKVWALEKGIEVVQPEKLKEYFPPENFDLFVVAEYGKIIPERIINLPKFKTINVHPSLLPKFRGPSPIKSFILSGEKETGVTIMEIDKEMDHGPIILQKKHETLNTKHETLERELAEMGAEMLVEVIPKWINGEIKAEEQNHAEATYCQKIKKEDGLVDLKNDDPKTIYQKFLAFHDWPGVFFFTERNGEKVRVIIEEAELKSNELLIKQVRPEGKKTMPYQDFLRGNKI